MIRKSSAIIAAALSAVMLVSSCTGPAGGSGQNGDLTDSKVTATIILESGDEIELELYPDLAPETVENFVELAEDGFYDGTIFHRVVKDFVIQGGGYNENLKEQKTSAIKGEFAENNFENNLKHERGVISMARLPRDVNSATSQFFICLDDLSETLDGKYAAFGRVTEGMDVVDDIASERTGTVTYAGLEDVPVDPIIIDTIIISAGDSSDKDKDDEDEDDDSASSKSSKKSSSKKTSSPSPTPRVLPNFDDDEDTSSADSIDDIDLSDIDFDSLDDDDLYPSSTVSPGRSSASIDEDEDEPIARGVLPIN